MVYLIHIIGFIDFMLTNCRYISLFIEDIMAVDEIIKVVRFVNI